MNLKFFIKGIPLPFRQIKNLLFLTLVLASLNLQSQSDVIVSAFFGLDNRILGICPGVFREDGMPLNFKYPIDESEIDLIFLDIHLADGKSFEIFNQIEVKTPIIFTTAYDQYALQAFKQTSVDYLLKPIQEDDLAKAVEKYKSIFKQEKTEAAPDYLALLKALQPEQKELKERFIVYVGSKIRSVEVGDVEVMYSENKSTFILTKEGKRYDVNYALDKLINLLDDRQFFRVNRKAILNISSIKEVHQFSKGKLKIDLKNSPGFDVFVSLERMTKFKKWLNR